MAEIKVSGGAGVGVMFGLVLAEALFGSEYAIRALWEYAKPPFLADGHVCQVDVAAVCTLHMADKGAFGTEAILRSLAVLGAVMKGEC